MNCRLCLEVLIKDSVVPLFDCTQGFNYKKIVELILKYFQIEVTVEDPVSNKICRICFDHLNNFHSFWERVEKKQKTLMLQPKTEFLEVNCETLQTDEDNLLDMSTEDKSVNVESLYDVLLEPPLIQSDDDTDDDNIGYDIFSSDEIPLEKLREVRKKKTEPSKIRLKSKKSLVAKEEISDKTKKSAYAACVTKDIELYCELCFSKDSIGNYEELINHFSEQHAGQKAFIKCCGKTLNTRRTFSRHLVFHRNPEKFKCAICDKQLGSRTSLITHIKAHQEVRVAEHDSLNCKLCDRSFSTEKRYENHLIWHEKQEKPEFNCPYCNKTYTNERRLKRHVHGQHDHVCPHKCLACSEQFNSKEDLASHANECKKKIVQITETTELDGSLNKECQCNICHKILSRTHLKRHMDRVHSSSVPYVCHECGKNFKFKKGFEKHLLEHSGVTDPPVQCEKCGKWLKNKNSHRLHMYRHDGFSCKCHLCGRECPSRPALKGHIENVHRHEKDHKCRFCEKSFKTPKSLNEHIATHTGDQLYFCPHCPKGFRSRANMYVHIKNTHVEEWIESKKARSHDPNIKKDD